MALFPRLADCSHFHYENSGVSKFKIKIKDVDKGQLVLTILSHDNSWETRRTWSHTVAMDEQFHECVISRATTNLRCLSEVPFLRNARSSTSLFVDDYPENRSLQRSFQNKNSIDDESRIVHENRSELMKMMKDYFVAFSTCTSTPINCAPILNYFEMDNHGYRLTVPDEDVVNKPAIAAAQVIRRHVAQDSDEITLEVGGYVSIVDMASDTPWWRGKLGIRVGFFPAECVALIGARGATSSASLSANDAAEGDSGNDGGPYKQVALNRGKIISRLVWSLFGKPRPTPLQLRRKGILRDRVFGCDLGVYLSASRREVPLPLMVCAQIIEDYGLVDGIYRRSGVQTHVQELRRFFDEDRRPPYDSDLISSDVHCFSSLLKTYFGELPTPLFNPFIYSLLSQTIRAENEMQRLNAMFRVLSRLAPPYFRTARYLFVHLNKLTRESEKTLMTAKNLAICWAPNLMKPTKKIDYNKPAPSLFTEVRESPLIVEYIITYARQLFCDRPPNWSEVLAAKNAARHSCVATLTGSEEPAQLISLAEARRRYGCKSSNSMSGSGEVEEPVTVPLLSSKPRTRSVVESPRRGSFELDAGDVFVRPIISDPFSSTGSPPLSRPRGGPSLQILQQKQQIIRQAKQRQAIEAIEIVDGRQRSHSLADDENKMSTSPGSASGVHAISEVRQEQAKRPRRIKLPFSPGSRLSRAKSSAGSVEGGVIGGSPPSSSCQVGASVFYLRANSVPAQQPSPPATIPTPSKSLPSAGLRLSSAELASCRSGLRSSVRQRSASPSRPPEEGSGEKENVRSSFQRLQDSWQRRSTRSSASPVLPRAPSISVRSSSPSSSSSSSSTTPAASPRSVGEGEGQKTPTQASSPVLIRARAVPSKAPPPVAPRSTTARHSATSLPDYENLDVFRRSCGLVRTEAESLERKKRCGANLDGLRPKPRRLPLEASQPPQPGAAFKRNSPIRQSLPTRMDRLLTRFPTEIRCYLPETNV